jgi:hypothetical protein
MKAISDSHLAHDQQIADAMAYLALCHPAEFTKILVDFPEWIAVEFNGACIDWWTMGVDPDWSMWLTDAIERGGRIRWDDGEPWTVGEDR